MKSLEVCEKNLINFLNNIREADLLELKALFKDKYKEEFLKICLNNNSLIYFPTLDGKNPLMIGGVVLRKDASELKFGQVWLLCTNLVEKNKISAFRYIKERIEEFKIEFDVLFNYIYKSNFRALLWLNLLGFSSLDLKNPDYKFFYFKKEGVNFDTRRFTC